MADLLKWFRRAESQQDAPESRGLENPAVGLGDAEAWAETFQGELSGAAGETVNRETALSVPAIWAAVNVHSSTIASLPLHVYRRNGEDRDLLKNSPIYRMLHTNPNKRWTSYRWRKYMMLSVLLDGRSYNWIDRPQPGNVRGIWPLNPQAVTPRWNQARGEVEYRYQPDYGPAVTYNEADIIDIPWMLQPDGVDHVRPLSKLKRAIGLSIALERYATTFFESGGVPPLALEGPIKSGAAAQRASEDILQRLLRRRNKNVLVLPEGHTLKQVGFNPEQAQSNEARRFQIEEVARVYDIPPVFLQDLTHGTFSNTEQQDLHFVKHSLTQWITTIEQEMNLKLFPNGGNRFAEFSVEGLLRGDFQTRMSGYATAIQNAINTPNEVRRRENMPPKEGGDDLHLQENMSQLDLLGQDQGGPGGEGDA